MSGVIDLVITGTLCHVKGLPDKVADDILYIFTEVVGDLELIERIKNFPVCKLLGDSGLESRAYLGAKDSNGDIILPIGFLNRVKSYLLSLNFRFNVIRDISHPVLEVQGIKLAEHLRSYQVEAVTKALETQIGIIQLPTGSGKTEIMMEILRQSPSGVNKLILVPTKVLLHQTVKAISERLGISVGVIGDGKFEVGEVTVAIPNTIDIRLKEGCSSTVEYCASIHALMVDECHDVISEPRVWRMISLMTNKVITLGFSATPWLENGINNIMTALLGSVIVEGKVSDFMDSGVIETPIIRYYEVPKPPLPPSIITRMTKARSGGYDGNLLALLDNVCIVSHKARNELIVKLVGERLKLDSGPIALVVNKVGTSNSDKLTSKGKPRKVISHSDILRDLILEQLGVEFPLLHGGTSSNDSKRIVEQLIAGELPGVIAGPAALTNGLNIPCLNTIFLCGGGKKSSDVLQRVGRVLRRFGSNSNRPLVVDFFDNVLYFKSHSEKRLKVCQDTYGRDNVKIITIEERSSRSNNTNKV